MSFLMQVPHKFNNELNECIDDILTCSGCQHMYGTEAKLYNCGNFLKPKCFLREEKFLTTFIFWTLGQCKMVVCSSCRGTWYKHGAFKCPICDSDEVSFERSWDVEKVSNAISGFNPYYPIICGHCGEMQTMPSFKW